MHVHPSLTKMNNYFNTLKVIIFCPKNSKLSCILKMKKNLHIGLFPVFHKIGFVIYEDVLPSS